jgi:hypothetical protein
MFFSFKLDHPPASCFPISKTPHLVQANLVVVGRWGGRWLGLGNESRWEDAGVRLLGVRSARVSAVAVWGTAGGNWNRDDGLGAWDNHNIGGWGCGVALVGRGDGTRAIVVGARVSASCGCGLSLDID